MALSQTCACKDALAQAREIAARHRGEVGPLLPTLHEVQRQVKYLSPAVLAEIAEQLGLPLSKVYATATFYTLFNTRQKGRYIVRVCESAPCHLGGAERLLEELKQLIGIAVGETTADGMFTLETASCLGVCGVAPALMINDEVHGNLRPGDLARLLGDYRQRAEKEV